MKILFTGPLRDFSGFATASRNFLLALLASEEVDVVARALKYDQIDSGQQINIDGRIEEAMKRPLTDIQMVIQMTTANIEAQPVPNVVNGLFSFFETDRIPVSWAQKANTFDFVMVPCVANAQALVNSGVRRPIMVCQPPCDKDIYAKTYPAFQIKNAGDRTIFYNICQISQKKGLDSLLRAYYAAFLDRPNEVMLVLKTYIGMQNRANDAAQIKHFVERVKQGVRLPIETHPPVVPILGAVDEDSIHGLHGRGDAYVCSSRGEGWGIPVFDALCHGKTVITNNHGGLGMFVNEANALVYGGTITNCFDMPHPDPALYTGAERWFEPSTAQMSDYMRIFHLLRMEAKAGTLNEENQKQWDQVLSRRETARTLAGKFDYRAVGSKITEQLVFAYENWRNTGLVAFKEKE